MKKKLLNKKSKTPARSNFAAIIDCHIAALRAQTKRVIQEDSQLLQANRKIMDSIYPPTN